ncbi:phosphotransferase family protein [Micromonospora sp. AMSO31t]|uniref:phosphotransferase family protein n=1 Tax=Micromonospora sp. AMSO31t TaxID=2650566 RepID=UPI001CEDDD1F|nr:phosphotransferase [Micromonospora sp. AMSO31t]
MPATPAEGTVRSADGRTTGPGATATAPLASGRTADVYALDGGRVLRRYRSGGDVRAEAEVMRHLHAVGYPVPRVHHADGPDLVLDRLAGRTLFEAIAAGEVTPRSGAGLLADLHARLHALPAPRSTDPAVRLLHLACTRRTCFSRRPARSSSTGPAPPRGRPRWTGR